MAGLTPPQVGLKVALSEQTVKGKTRVDRLSDVKSLNCWGQDLADVSILSQMPNVEVAELAEVQWLVDLPDLRVLWLSDNPCADIPKYRQKVLQYLPKLTKLDNDDVTDEEKRDAETKADATQADTKAPIASSAACEPNPILEQKFKPAELQAALGTSPLPVDLQAQDASCTPAPVQSAAPTPLPTAKPALVLQRQSVSFNARNGLPARPHSNLAPASGCSSNVLYAVIALLGDLDKSSLHIVKAESIEAVASKAQQNSEMVKVAGPKLELNV
ncbi:TPA: hypothetical protein ACH3X3_014812 [Trebouxia sp. C0006]